MAFDLMLGRQEHQAFRSQLEAATIPVESSPPIMQAATELVQQALLVVISSGTGGLIVTAAGTAIAFLAKTAGRVMADEAAAMARRSARSLTTAGRVQNENELITLQNDNLELKRKQAELQALLEAARAAIRPPTPATPP